MNSYLSLALALVLVIFTALPSAAQPRTGGPNQLAPGNIETTSSNIRGPLGQQDVPGSLLFGSQGAQGNLGNNSNFTTGSQTRQFANGRAPVLQGATNGTIGPQGSDATSIVGINTAGTVRVNNLANIEALLNIIANGMEILGIAWGGPTIIVGFMRMAAGTHDAMKRVLFGAGGVTGGLATPGAINWLVASSRDANLFS